MDNGLNILKGPILSEKSTGQTEIHNQVVFEVSMEATKPQIREAIKRFYKVKVENVNTMVVPGKPFRTKAGFGKRTSWKKAIITLKDGEKIEFFKGV